MDYRHPADVETFRAEVRTWLEAELPDDLRGLPTGLDWTRETVERLRRWNRTLAAAGYAAIAWPVEYGGRGAGALEQAVLAEEMDRAEAPGPLNPIGLANIAPAIMQWGSESQKRSLLPRMLRGDDIWCQGFSEPDAGSDLAALRTSARREGDCWVVDGQKTWNTLGPFADWCELLVRTDPDAPKHAGISCLLVDMRLPGISVRPITTITGGREFSEIFFDGVRVPRDALLGPLHQGWQVALTTLAHERAGVAALHLSVRRKVRRLIAEARRCERDGRPVSEHPVVRQALARAYLHAEHLGFLAWRALSAERHGRPPGPESSLAKLAWSDVENHVAEAAGLAFGPAANSGEWGQLRLSVRQTSIAGGTTQVNKNILARRVLGLPKAG
jgi:alkylation response protein AidB-like acyl-CoA dehydrogenase